MLNISDILPNIMVLGLSKTSCLCISYCEEIMKIETFSVQLCEEKYMLKISLNRRCLVKMIIWPLQNKIKV